MRIAIIGGGISGLYLAYKLSREHQVDIYEKSERLGGRIRSLEKDDMTLETGAGRINQTHKRVWKIIKELRLEDEVIKMPATTIKYVKDGKSQKNPSASLKELIKLSGSFSKTYLKTVNFDFFARSHFQDSVVDDMMYSFGYDSEFLNYNAYDALKSMKNDLSDDNVYYVFKHGLSTLVSTLVSALDSRVKIHMNHQINSKIDLDKLPHDKIITCVTSNDLKAFDISTDAVGNPLARVYAKFPTPAWFKGIGKVTTNNQIRQFIPIDSEKGIAMASYCTDKWAENWNNLSDPRECLMHNLRKTFPKINNIPDPEWVSLHYWEIGAHAWTTRARENPRLVKNKNKASDRVFVSGEVVSMNHHGWIEGALEAADETLKLFVNS